MMARLCLFILSGLLSINVMAQDKPVTIGILVPIEHIAMNEIIKGYETTLNKIYPGKVTYLVKNAQSDMNLMRAILQEFKNRQVDVVAPIGTQATQMAISMIKKQPIIGIAALVSDKDRAKQNNITAVIDEVPVATQIKFIRSMMPFKKITLVYSPDNKIFPDLEMLKSLAKKDDFQLQSIMVQQLSDLYTISRQIANDTDLIFVLKDHLIVSGISTLVNAAKKLNIPVVTSDEGSVQGGAAYALGVTETQIGVDSAKLTLDILNGESPKDVPIFHMRKMSVFVNQDAMKQQHVEMYEIQKAAKQMGYDIKNVTPKGKEV